MSHSLCPNRQRYGIISFKASLGVLKKKIGEKFGKNVEKKILKRIQIFKKLKKKYLKRGPKNAL